MGEKGADEFGGSVSVRPSRRRKVMPPRRSSAHAQQGTEEAIDDCDGFSGAPRLASMALRTRIRSSLSQSRRRRTPPASRFLGTEVVIDRGQIDPASPVIWRIECPRSRAP
jgi:hypothetical protein